MAGRLISLLNSAFGSGLSLRQRCACVQRGTIVTQRCLAVFLQIENSSQIDMRPGHHFRLLRDLESALEITARPLYITIHCRNLRKDKQRAALIPLFSSSARSEEHTSELQSPMYLVC